jgi:hypothetical protein
MRNLNDESGIAKHRGFSTDALIQECRVITQYLLGQEPPQDLINRYIEANSIHFTGETSHTDLAIVAFVRRNPWSLPFLDAVSGFFRPNSLLRKKILLMIAILEAAPQFAVFFLPERFSIPRFLWRMSGYGLSSAVKFMIGCFIYPFAVNAR